MWFYRLYTFPEQILVNWAIRQLLSSENWSGVHSLWISSLLSGPSYGSPLQQEGSCLLRTLFHLPRHDFCHLPRRLHFLWETAMYWQHVRNTWSRFTIFTHILSLHLSQTVAYFFVVVYSVQGHWCEKKVNETHLALSLRVGYALTCKGKLGFLETEDPCA